jgi:phage repressor protein C with HTH and peptisase S24 domain
VGFGFAVVNGHSMIPAFAPGERVLVKYGADYSESDVVLVDFTEASGQKRIDLKRIVKIEGYEVFVEGDNSEVSIDSRQYGPVRPDQIIAKVIYRLPKWLNLN